MLSHSTRGSNFSHLSRLLLSAALLCTFLHLQPVSSQAVDPDKVDFTTISIWINLRQCLQGVFSACCARDIAGQMGCQTNTCLCRASTLGGAVPLAGDMAMAACSNLDDKSSATSILTAYCASKGYTNVVAPTILSTQGASTVTITVAMGTVTAAGTTVYVSAASVRPVPPLSLSLVKALTLTGIMLGSILCLVFGRKLIFGGYRRRALNDNRNVKFAI